MKVELTYFKPSGKYYASGDYETEKKEIFEIFEEVREMLNNGIRPGLCEGSTGWTTLINVPDHPHNHPHLSMSKE